MNPVPLLISEKKRWGGHKTGCMVIWMSVIFRTNVWGPAQFNTSVEEAPGCSSMARASSVLSTILNCWTRSCIATSDWPSRNVHLHLLLLTSTSLDSFVNYPLPCAPWKAKHLLQPCAPSRRKQDRVISAQLSPPLWQLITFGVNSLHALSLFWKIGCRFKCSLPCLHILFYFMGLFDSPCGFCNYCIFPLPPQVSTKTPRVEISEPLTAIICALYFQEAAIVGFIK